MSAVSSRQFWEHFFQSENRSEWYFSLCPNTNDTDNTESDKADSPTPLEGLLSAEFRKDAHRVILHAGSGNVFFNASFFNGLCLQFDFSVSALRQGVETDYHPLNLVAADAMMMPFLDNLFDLIVEKGLFDSITGRSDLAVNNAHSLLNEYHRCLKADGKVFVFSIFGPSSESKDMLGLLRHSELSVECRSLYISPAEIPTQDFCFVYILTKVKISND